MTFVTPPRRPAWYLRIALWVARRITGKPGEMPLILLAMEECRAS